MAGNSAGEIVMLVSFEPGVIVNLFPFYTSIDY